ncbi:MAG: redoxin domain-containing protein [Phycisphaerae bacterium]
MREVVVAVWCTAGVVLAAGGGAHASVNQTPNRQVVPENASEDHLVQKIRRLGEVARGDVSTAVQANRAVAAEELLLSYVDALLKRYPNSAFKEEALTGKLRSLAHLARSNQVHLAQLLSLTHELSEADVSGTLACENAYYSIQAFVLGARREAMPLQRRLRGAIERYRAFLEDFPRSSHAPVIRASLIRDLFATNDGPQAFLEFAKLKQEHPDHPATRRAAGEVNKLRALGRPFNRVLTTSAGQTVHTADHMGKVLVIQFWASSSQKAVEQIAELVQLYHEHRDDGLDVVAINLDRDEKLARKAIEASGAPWPQYFEPKGVESDVVIDYGVVALPTCFILDRNGMLRTIDPGEKLSEIVRRLLTEQRR